MFSKQRGASLILLSASTSITRSSCFLLTPSRTFRTLLSTKSSQIAINHQQHSSHYDIIASSSSSASLFSTMKNTYDQTPNEIQMTKDVLEITQAAINAVNPEIAIETHLSYDTHTHTLSVTDAASSKSSASSSTTSFSSTTTNNHSYNLSKETCDEIVICAFGKAATSMAIQTAKIVSKSNIPIKGIVITKYDHATEEQIYELQSYNIEVEFASHPIPDDASIQASNRLLDLIKKQEDGQNGKRTFIFNCISGGGSSLFCTPRPPLTLSNIAHVNQQLLACGMPITEMNIIRKKLEIGKGGGLVGLAYDHPNSSSTCNGIVTMVLSDVIGDPLDLIASGPSVPDQSTWNDAWELVERYDLKEGGVYAFEPSVLEILTKGKEITTKDEGVFDDLPSSDHPVFCTECPLSDTKSKMSETVLVGNNAQAVYAAAEKAESLGYNPIVLGTTIEGEAMHIANMYISMAEQASLQRITTATSSSADSSALYPFTKLPAAIIGGGETTVTLSKNHGKGGRNQEIGLVAALKMQSCGIRDVVLASVGTDGTDGPTDAAGAVVDGGTIDRIETENGGKLFGKDALEKHDAYTFFDNSNCSADDSSTPLVRTGPTGTNVADVCVTLIR